MRAERNVFGKLALLSIGHNVDLELTLPFSLETVPWSLLTPDGIPIKTDESKLLDFLESHFEPTIDRPCSAAHNFDGIAILQSLTVFPVTFEDQKEQYLTSHHRQGMLVS